MYIPEIYKNENQEEIHQFLHENGFAILVNQTNGKLWATHIPLYFEPENNLLHWHLSIENPQSIDFKNDDEVLVIFQGNHTYISSSWYDHENVPTWNYIAVHVYGKIKILSHDETILHLKKLVVKYEANQEKPVKIDRTHGGSDNYTLTFPSGDVYTHDEILKPGATIHRFGYYSDDFTYVNRWNGIRIESYAESAERKNARWTLTSSTGRPTGRRRLRPRHWASKLYHSSPRNERGNNGRSYSDSH